MHTHTFLNSFLEKPCIKVTFKLLLKHCCEGVNLANMANCPFLENVPPQIGIICSPIIQYAMLSRREIYKNNQNMLLFMWQEINLPSLAFKSNILQKKAPLCGAHYALRT